MSNLIVTKHDGSAHQIEATVGRSVMEIIRGHGIDDLAAICGGMLSCATCHVYVEGGPDENLAPISEEESELLDGSSHRQGNSRLSCQIVFDESLDGLRLTVAPEG